MSNRLFNRFQENEKIKKITIQDIADAVGVNKGTVCRALNNKGRMKEETRLKIREAASNLGYRPNPFASALASQKKGALSESFRGMIACIHGHSDRPMLKKLNRYKTSWEGICERARQLGYDVREFWRYAEEFKMYQLERALWTMNITGVIFLGIHEDEVQLNWSQFSCAYACGFGGTEWEMRFSGAIWDVVADMSFLVKRILLDGYKKPALLLSNREDEKAEGRLSGSFRFHLAKAGLNPEPGIFRISSDLNELMPRFKSYQPDVLICFSTLHQVLPVLTENNISIPEQLKCVELNCTDQSGDAAGVVPPWKDMGKAAVDLVIGSLHREERGYPDVFSIVHLRGVWKSGWTYPE